MVVWPIWRCLIGFLVQNSISLDMSLILLLFHVYFLSTLVVCHLHPNIYQHSWKLLEIYPTTMLDVLYFQFYAGIDGENLVLNSCQQGPRKMEVKEEERHNHGDADHGSGGHRETTCFRGKAIGENFSPLSLPGKGAYNSPFSVPS